MSILRRYLPITGWLPAYDPKWLAGDAVAGLSVWALLVPQSLAYATLAGVPVQYGLYTAFAALIAYPIFGTSRQLVQGPSAAVCAVSAAAITPIVGTSALGSTSAVGYTAALAIATGLVYIALGLLRMGWVSTFLSKAVLSGFVLGFAIGIVIDQLNALLGVTVTDDSYAEELWSTIEKIPDTQLTTLAVGAGSLGLLLVMRRFLPRWPRMLIVVALAIAASSALDLADHGVAVTGDVPTGLFSVGLPDVGLGEWTALLTGALSIVFVGVAESLAAAPSMARKHSYEIDVNQELIAQGVACSTSGLVGGSANGQPFQDVGRRRRRQALADGVAHQRRIHPAHDAVPRRAVQDPARRHARSGRHRRDDRADHSARGQALLHGQPCGLAVLHGRGPGDPVLRDHPRGPDRRHPLAAAAGLALVAHVDPRAPDRSRIGHVPRPVTPRRPRAGVRRARRPRRRPPVLRGRRPLPRARRGAAAGGAGAARARHRRDRDPPHRHRRRRHPRPGGGGARRPRRHDVAGRRPPAGPRALAASGRVRRGR